MNGPLHPNLSAPITLPVEFEALCPAPQLLPGESLERYRSLQAAIFRDLTPQSAIEWLLAIEIAELSWEIQRYRLLRQKVLETHRQKAIEATLRRIDVAGVLPDFKDQAELYTVQNAIDWQLDPIANREIEARLASYGFDQSAITTEAYAQAREIFELFEGLLHATQLRRLCLLREINGQRGILARARPINGERNDRPRTTELSLLPNRK